MSTDWRTLPMAAVMAEFYDGPHATPAPADDGPVYLGIKNMTEDGHLNLSDIRHISEDDYEIWTRRVVPRPGDVVFTYEASLHRYAIIPEGFRGALGRRVALLRPNPGVVDTRFLLCAFISPQWRRTIESRLNIGSTVDRVPLVDFPNYPITLPPLPTQRKIAAILSAYDDLIENNNRRIKLLEEMAQRIYREWFVDFRYPGHQGIPLVDTELGPIPQGWKVSSVGDHAILIRGRSYRGVDVVDEGGLPFVSLKCVARDGGFRADGLKRYVGDFKAAHRVFPGDIVMAVTDMTQERRIVARAARVPNFGEEFGVMSMDLVNLVPRDLPSEYLYATLRYSSFPDEVKAHANGANVLHLNPDRIADFRTVFPPSELADAYGRLIAPTGSLCDILQAASRSLRATRDLVLPGLISGEIDVDNLAIELPDAA